jgi:uncharacterized Tic20 family protein
MNGMSNTTTSSAGSPAGQRTTLSVLVHFIGLVFGFIGSGVVYLVTDDEFTKANARNSVNWWLLMLGAAFVLLMVTFLLSSLGDIFVILGTAVSVVLGAISLRFAIWAAVKANNGELWESPLAPNLI